MAGARTLVLDIETSPNLAHVWALFNQDIGLSQLMESTQVIAFAAKWRGDRKTYFYSDFHDGHDEMVKAAWDLVDEADVVVHYNGTSFDMPHLHREFLLSNLGPTSPVKEVDLLKVVKGNFRFPSNKLQFVSTALGLPGKTQHTGHDLWVKCLNGDPNAWALMKKYNKNDVVITEQLYDILVPWIKSPPHAGLYIDDGSEHCPRCGGTSLQRRGRYYAAKYSYPRFQCQDCKGWLKGARSESKQEFASVS